MSDIRYYACKVYGDGVLDGIPVDGWTKTTGPYRVPLDDYRDVSDGTPLFVWRAEIEVDPATGLPAEEVVAAVTDSQYHDLLIDDPDVEEIGRAEDDVIPPRVRVRLLEFGVPAAKVRPGSRVREIADKLSPRGRRPDPPGRKVRNRG